MRSGRQGLPGRDVRAAALELRVSGDAEADLISIAGYTAERFGLAQELKYRDGLRRAMELLLTFPQLGADQSQIALGLRRHVHASHVVYYSVHDFGVLIERVLGPGQDPMREFGEGPKT